MKRLEERRRVRLFAELGSTMKLPRSGPGPPLARGPGARRPRAPADDPDPRVPREAARGRGRPRRLTMADRQLRVLIAPDSFKGSLTSVQVARALADGWHRARPGDDLHLAPLADGGEGTLIAIEAAGGWQWREADAHRSAGAPDPRPLAPPRGRPCRRAWRWPPRRACRSSPPPSATRRARPARARATCCGPCSTRGSATSRSGIGGSATTDGGAGLLRSLGAEVSDDLATVDLDGLDAAPRPRRGCGSPAT